MTTELVSGRGALWRTIPMPPASPTPAPPPNPPPHPSAYAVRLAFGSFSGTSLGELTETARGRDYLAWLARQTQFSDPFWPPAARATLAGLPVAPHPTAEAAAPTTAPAPATPATAAPPTPSPHRRVADSPARPGAAGSGEAPSVRLARPGWLTVDRRGASVDMSHALAGVAGRRWVHAARVWEVPVTQARHLVAALGGPTAVVMDAGAHSAYTREADRRETLDTLRAATTDAPDPGPIPGLVQPLWPYQRAAVGFALACDGRVVFAHEVGLGKTPMAIATALALGARRTLVLCPASLKIGWVRKLRYFAATEGTVWDGDRVVGSLDAPFHVTSYEIFVRRRAEFVALGVDLVIVDECHNFCNPTTRRSLALYGGRERVKEPGTGRVRYVTHPPFVTRWCVMLTATPLNNHPRELFPALHHLHPARFPSFFEYAMRYGAFAPGNLAGRPSTPRNLEELHERIGDIVLRVLESEVGTTRPRAHPDVHLWLELTPEDRAAYRALVDDVMGAWAASGKPTLPALHVLRAWLNARKLPLVWQTIDALHAAGEAVVLFSTRLEPLQATIAHYGLHDALLTGAQTPRRRQRAIDAFSEGRLPLLAISLRAGGTGIDELQYGGRVVIFLDLDFVPALHTQAKGRLDRTGQREPVQAYYALVKGTVDEYLYDLLATKAALADRIIDGRERRAVARQSLFRAFVARLRRAYQADTGRRVALQVPDPTEGAAAPGELDEPPTLDVVP